MKGSVLHMDHFSLYLIFENSSPEIISLLNYLSYLYLQNSKYLLRMFLWITRIFNQLMNCCQQGECHEFKGERQEHHHENDHHHEQVIQDQTEEEKLRLKRQKLGRRRNESVQNKKKYLPLLKFLKKNGLKFKTAAVQKNSVQYFRIDNLKELLQVKRQLIEANETVSKLLKNWQRIFIYYDRPENQPHFKWPQQLESSEKNANSKFASFPFDSSQSSKTKSILFLIGVIGIVLFPLWPFELKYYLWLVGYYLAIALVGTIVLRLVLYMFFSIFGASLWVFPKLFDNVEFIQSFKPVLSISWWEGSTIYSIVTRLLVLSIFTYYGYHIYIDPSIINENIEITKTIMDDINDWGVSKIKGERNFSQSALTDYSKLLNTTVEEEGEEESAGYTSIESAQL